MLHLDEERLERLVHGELVPQVESTTREHLATCAECRARVAAVEREQSHVQALLGHLDGPAPRVDVGTIVRAAESRASRWRPWAAGIVLAAGLGGAAYAIPGSPVAAWVRTVVRWIGSGDAPSTAVTVPIPPPGAAPAPGPGIAGIAVAPGRDLRITFAVPRGQVRVAWADGDQVVVRGPAASATFTSDVGQLRIDNKGPTSTFDIDIPRAAARVEILVQARRVFLKDGPRVTPAPPNETTPAPLLSLEPPDE